MLAALNFKIIRNNGFKVGSLSVELNHRLWNFVPVATSRFSLRLAASWVFQRRAIGFPSRLPIERAHRRVIKDRIGGTPGELGGNGPAHSCACARAYTPVEYLIGRNNYRRAVVYTGPYSRDRIHIYVYATGTDNIAGTIGWFAK